MFDWLPTMFGDFWDWLAGRIQVIIDLLSPLSWLFDAYQYFLSFLPFKNPFIGHAIIYFAWAWVNLVPYAKFAAVFVDVTFMLGCVMLTFTSELLLLVFRVWRTIRSIVT